MDVAAPGGMLGPLMLPGPPSLEGSGRPMRLDGGIGSLCPICFSEVGRLGCASPELGFSLGPGWGPEVLPGGLEGASGLFESGFLLLPFFSGSGLKPPSTLPEGSLGSFESGLGLSLTGLRGFEPGTRSSPFLSESGLGNFPVFSLEPAEP